MKAGVSADSIEFGRLFTAAPWELNVRCYDCSSSLKTNCYYFLDKIRGDYTYLPMSAMLDFLEPMLIVMLDLLDGTFGTFYSSSTLGDCGTMHSCYTVYLSDSN